MSNLSQSDLLKLVPAYFQHMADATLKARESLHRCQQLVVEHDAKAKRHGAIADELEQLVSEASTGKMLYAPQRIEEMIHTERFKKAFTEGDVRSARQWIPSEQNVLNLRTSTARQQLIHYDAVMAAHKDTVPRIDQLDMLQMSTIMATAGADSVEGRALRSSTKTFSKLRLLI